MHVPDAGRGAEFRARFPVSRPEWHDAQQPQPARRLRGILKGNMKYRTPGSGDTESGRRGGASAASRPNLPTVRRRRSDDDSSSSRCGDAGFPGGPGTVLGAQQSSYFDLESDVGGVDGAGQSPSTRGRLSFPPPLRRSSLELSVTRVLLADEDPLSRRVAMLLFQVASVRSTCGCRHA